MKKQILTAMLLCSSILVRAQSKDWQHLDLEKDKVFGISADKTYEELLKGHKAKTVIVAILDGGADTSHIDLKPVLWVNPKEKAGNGKDDDHNGYADDVHGWNFIGGPQGNVNYDNLELVRLIRRGDGKNHPEMQEDYDRQLKNAQNSLTGVTTFKNILDTIVASINKPAPAFADFKAYSPESLGQANVRQVMLNVLKKSNLAEFLQNEIGAAITHFQTLVSYQLNPAFDPRSIVGDNYNDDKQRFYGNNNVTGPNALHGSHVAGIVGADRSDTTGIKGIADHVKLMIVRVVPDGDERDKDIANGIRYAADNGASIINMSFGKPYSWDKPAVDAAVKYAISKDILLVQGAGNSAQNTDSTANFPNRVYADGSGTAGAWINVGASGWVNDTTLCASFSNYGLNTVDVFAPGERIYSTVPGSGYQRLDGTSMAAPVVAGLAALIREYYPKLTAVQVKDIILRSVVKIDHNVTINKNGKPLSVPFSSLCKSGGIINAYNALQLAASYK